MSALSGQPIRRLLPFFVVSLVAAGTMVAVAPVAPARAADPTPPCSTKSIDEGAAYPVPAGVTKVRITSYGEAGEAGIDASHADLVFREAGAGSKVTADVAVSQGDVLQPMRINGGTKGGGGQRYNGQVPDGLKWAAYGTNGGAARGVVRIQPGCRQVLVVGGGGGGNGSRSLPSSSATDPNGYGRGLSSSGGAAGLPSPGGGGQAGRNGTNDQEDGAGGGGASLTGGGGSGAAGRNALSACPDGQGGQPGGFEFAGAGGNGNDQGECDPRSGAGGGGAGYYGGGGGGSHQSSGSGSGAGGGGSSYVLAGATNISYEVSRAGAGTTITPIYTPAGAPTSVTAVAHNRRAVVSFTAPANPYSIGSYTVTSIPGGFTTSVTGTGALTGTVTGLTNGTAYRFTVTANPAAGVLLDGSPAVSPQSNQVTPVTEIPTTVRNFTAVGGNGTAQLTWDAPADDGGSTIIDYTVTWPSGAGSRGQVATGTSMTVNQGLINGRSTQFTIVPRNSVGSGPSSFTSATPHAVALPVMQPTPTGTGGNGFVDVRFTPAEPGYDQFVVTTTPAPNCGNASTAYTADYGYGFPYGVRVGCLSNGVSYRFSVAARNDRGVGPTSDLSAPVIPTLTAPTFVAGTVTRGLNKLVVEVDNVDNGGSPVTSFSAYAVPFQSPDVGTSDVVTVPVTTPGGLPDITIPDLVTGVLYQVFITATNANGTMAYTSVGYARPYGVPEAPTEVSVTVPSVTDGGKLDVAFRTAQRAECGTYEITANPGGLTKTGQIGNGGSECGNNQFNQVRFDGLTNGTPYTFTVRVVDAVTGAGPSSEATDPVMPYATKRPAPVTGVVAAPAGSGKARVTFDPAPDDNWKYPVTSYRVSWGDGSTEVNPGDVDDGVLVSGLTNGREYVFTVVARNQVGDSDGFLSNPVTTTALAKPTNLSVELGGGAARLSFDGVGNNGGGHLEYVVTLRDLNPPDLTVVTDSSPVLLTGLVNDRFYHVTVKARNADGEGSDSDSIEVQAINGLPAMPTNVTATAGLAQATISWDRVVPVDFRDAPIEDYTVTAHPGGENVDVDDHGSGVGRVSTTMTGLTNGTAYRFTVHANVDSCPAGRCYGLESDPSNEVTPDRLTQDPITLTPSSGTYGTNQTVSALDGSGTGQLGDVTASGDACTMNGIQLVFVHATTGGHTCTISVTKAGDNDYKPRTEEQVVTISRKALTVTARDQDAVYGATFTKAVDYGTFVQGDNLGSLGGTLTFGGSAITAPGAGTRTLTPGGLTSTDYNLQFVSGTVTFSPLPVTLEIQPATKTYGDPNPALHANVVGDLVGDDELDYSLTTTATQASRPGPLYPITAVLGSNPNYDIEVHGDMLDVQLATLVVKADDVSAPYLAPPSFTVTVTGLVGSDNFGDIVGALRFDVSELSGPHPADTYVISPSGLYSPYYFIQYADGTLTRTKRPSTVTWSDPAPIVYGAALSPTELGATVDVPGTLTYSPDLGTVLHGGVRDLTVSFVPADPAIFLPSSKTVHLNVLKAPLTITADDATKVHGQPNPGFTVSHGPFRNGDTMPSLSGVLAFSTPAGLASPAGDYPITPSGLTSTDYAISFADGNLHVTKETPSLTWADPASIVYGAALSGTQLNAVASVAGAYTYSPPLGTVLHAGPNQSLQVTFVPTDTTSYVSTSKVVHLDVAKTPLTITGDDATKIYGQPNPGLSVTYGPFRNGDTALSLDGTLSVTTTADQASPAGNYPVKASGLTSPDYTISYVDGTLHVTKASPSLTWADPASIVYGTALSGTQLSATASVPGAFTYSPDLGTVLHAGPGQALEVTFVPDNADDYVSTSKTVHVRVTKAPLTVTADDATKTYLEPNPGFTVTYGPFRNGDTASSLTGTPTFSTSAVQSSPVGPYAVTPSGLSSPDYAISYLDGTLHVTKAATSVTWADPAAIVYGTPLSATQLDATASVPGTFTYSPDLGTLLHAGQDQVLAVTFVPTDGANYLPSTKTVLLDVTKAPLTVTVLDATRAFGEANPAFDATFGPLVGGDSLNGTVTYTTVGLTSPVGAYPIVGSGLTSPDYLITWVAGTLRISRAATAVSWGTPASIGYGTALLATQLNASAPVPGTFTYSPPLGTVLHAGTGQQLAVTFVPDDSTNYAPSSATARIDVGQAPLTVTVRNATKSFGSENPDFAVRYDRFRAGDTAGSLNGAPAFTTSADSSSPVGAYPVSAAGLSSPDYVISFVDGTLRVTRSQVVVTADDVSLDRSDRPKRIKFTATVTSAFDAKVSGVTVTFTVTKRNGDQVECTDETGPAGVATCRTDAVRSSAFPRSSTIGVEWAQTRNLLAGTETARLTVR